MPNRKETGLPGNSGERAIPPPAELCDALARVTRHLRGVALPDGLTIERLSTLGSIVTHGPVSLTRLADLEAVSVGAVSRSVRPLEAHDLVSREIDEVDRRSVQLSPTQKGIEVFDAATTKYIHHFVLTIGELEPSHRAAIVAMFSRPNAN